MWCIGSDNAENIMAAGNEIRIEMINPIFISKSLFSDKVCLRTIWYLFIEDAWLKLEEMVKGKKDDLQNQCNISVIISLDANDIVACEGCLLRFHFSCVKKKASKKKNNIVLP